MTNNVISQIQVDSRERPQAIGSILSAFDKNNIKWFRSKMVVADYCSLDNPRLVIDRKNNLQEVCGNLCQGHERFRNELLLAKDLGIQLILLIEHSRNIQTLSDVRLLGTTRA